MLCACRWTGRSAPGELANHATGQFEGVALSTHRTRSSDPLHISVKLLYKDSPFSGWVQERVRRRGTDALCVNSPADLRGDGARVTRSGQTRHGSRGAHGELSDVPIIGFSNAGRLAQIAADVAALTAQVGELARTEKALDGQLREIWQRKQAHQHVPDCTWDSIDVNAVDEQIRDREDQRERILATSDVLQTLQHEEKRLRGDLEDASREKFGAEHDRKTLDSTALSTRLSRTLRKGSYRSTRSWPSCRSDRAGTGCGSPCAVCTWMTSPCSAAS